MEVGTKEFYREFPFLYHGTTKPYLEGCLRRKGRYEHYDGDPVFLSHSLGLALGYAVKRGKQNNTEGTLLIIDTKKIFPRLETVHGMPVVKYLDENEFIRYDLEKGVRKAENKHIDEIDNLLKTLRGDNYG